ncbi:MAG: hypothetical protein AAF688_15930 [Bacteroidota bacterium]
MKSISRILTITAIFFFIQLTAEAQRRNADKNFSLAFGAGYFQGFVSDDGVAYDNAIYDPNVGPGVSYFISFDYHLSESFAIGLGYNGNYAGAEFVRNATVGEETINGFLVAGAVTNSHILLNATYQIPGEGIQPFGKLGVGYITQQVENGDVPLRLTNNVETEVFPDFKSSGFVVLPELGLRYQSFYLSLAYTLPFDELTGEDNPDGFVSPGTVSSTGLQLNLSYRVFLF